MPLEMGVTVFQDTKWSGHLAPFWLRGCSYAIQYRHRDAEKKEKKSDPDPNCSNRSDPGKKCINRSVGTKLLTEKISLQNILTYVRNIGNFIFYSDM